LVTTESRWPNFCRAFRKKDSCETATALRANPKRRRVAALHTPFLSPEKK